MLPVASKFDSFDQLWGLAKFDLYEGSGQNLYPRTMRASLSAGTMKAHQANPEKETRETASCRLANDIAKLSYEEEAHER